VKSLHVPRRVLPKVFRYVTSAFGSSLKSKKAGGSFSEWIGTGFETYHLNETFEAKLFFVADERVSVDLADSLF
jgi:hypothetical protein